DAPELRERVRDEALGVGRTAHVTDEREDLAPEALDLSRQAVEALPAETDLREPFLVLVARPARRHVRRDNVGASAGEGDGDRAAPPLRSGTSSHQHDLAVEFAHPSLLCPDRTPLLSVSRTAPTRGASSRRQSAWSAASTRAGSRTSAERFLNLVSTSASVIGFLAWPFGYSARPVKRWPERVTTSICEGNSSGKRRVSSWFSAMRMRFISGRRLGSRYRRGSKLAGVMRPSVSATASMYGKL